APPAPVRGGAGVADGLAVPAPPSSAGSPPTPPWPPTELPNTLQAQVFVRPPVPPFAVFPSRLPANRFVAGAAPGFPSAPAPACSVTLFRLTPADSSLRNAAMLEFPA